jgi:hypothetical protein
LFTELDAQRRFVGNADIATINGWARSKGSPVRLMIVSRINGLFVGRDTQNGRIVEIPSDFHRVLRDAVAGLVGIEGGVVSGVINLESSGVEAPDWRPRHDER